jgi:hypothetical protein
MPSDKHRYNQNEGYVENGFNTEPISDFCPVTDQQKEDAEARLRELIEVSKRELLGG